MKSKMNYSEFSSPELVTAFNELLASTGGKRLAEGNPRRYSEVQRFSDHKTAVARVEALASSIRAVMGAEEQETKPVTKKHASETREKPTATVRAPKKGGNREKLIAFMIKNKGQSLTAESLCQAVYGEGEEKRRGALMCCMGGMVAVDLDRRGLPYRLEKTKEGKETFFALHPKD